MPKFELPTIELPAEAARPLYVGVGATDLVVGYVRDAVADVQTRIAGLDLEPQTLREAVEARVAGLQADAQGLPAKVQGLIADNAATVNAAYADLAKRGETLVERIRRQESTKATASAASTTTAKAKTTKTQATKASSTTAKKTTKKATSTAKKSSAAPKSSAKATKTAAKKTASNAAQAATEAAEKVGD